MSATNRGKDRVENDFYPTPPWLTKAVLPILEERLKKLNRWQQPLIYEPACGDLAIVNEICSAWPHSLVDYSDIVKEQGGVDFLTASPEPIYDVVITNPPYSLAQEFCERAKLWLRTPDSLIVMLLRINFLGAKKRAKWLRANLPAVAVSPKRPSFGTNKDGKKGTDATEYAWFTWPGAAPWLSILETEDVQEKTFRRELKKAVDERRSLVQSH